MVVFRCPLGNHPKHPGDKGLFLTLHDLLCPQLDMPCIMTRMLSGHPFCDKHGFPPAFEAPLLCLCCSPSISFFVFTVMG